MCVCVCVCGGGGGGSCNVLNSVMCVCEGQFDNEKVSDLARSNQ